MIGEKIKYYRLSRNLSQTALAEKCGTTRLQIYRYEKGLQSPGAVKLKAISEALSISIDILMG
jgi:transcriptional regulator with XRE-family HTH domain